MFLILHPCLFFFFHKQTYDLMMNILKMLTLYLLYKQNDNVDDENVDLLRFDKENNDVDDEMMILHLISFHSDSYESYETEVRESGTGRVQISSWRFP